MGLVGAGYGASVALEGILEQALKEKALEQRREIELAQIEQRKQEADGMREHRQRLIDLDQIRLKADEKQAEIEQNQQGEKQRAFDNVAGLGDMGLDPQTARRESVVSLGRAGVANAPQYAREAFPDPEKPELKTYTYTDPKTGRQTLRSITLDEVQKVGGVDMGAEPVKPSASDKPDYQRVVVDGKETFLTPEEVRARGGVDAASRKRASTGMERQALGFFNRMKEALDTMDSVEDGLTERDIMLINDSPLPVLINNRMLSSAGQQYAQALSTYTEARLRKESGAAIPESEYASDRKTISRQAGDKDDVRGQKKQTRRTTAEGVAYAAGPAYEEFYGAPFQRAGASIQREIPGIDGAVAESTDGGKTWRRIK